MGRSFRAFVRAIRVAPLGASLVVGLLGSSCSSTEPPQGPAKALGLPAWAGTSRELFGDEIDPAAMGILPPKPARKDQTLWARAQQADIVGKVRIQTVTVDSRAGQNRYHLGLQFANPTLAQTKLEEREFEVTIDARDPAYGLVKAQDTALQGKTFVGFLKRFSGVDDEIDNHFYFAPDSAEVAAVVQEAVAVQEVSK